MTMFSSVTRHLFHSGIGAFALLLTAHAQADGMVPNTSVVIVNEADGEASVSVTNTDANLALMHVTLEDIAEDSESLVFVTPPWRASKRAKPNWCGSFCKRTNRCSLSA